jgi:hypothetical protein
MKQHIKKIIILLFFNICFVAAQTQVSGRLFDVKGKQVNPKSKEAHIPIKDFKFKKD